MTAETTAAERIMRIRMTATTTVNVPQGRSEHGLVWTGDSMVVWGGRVDDDPQTWYINSGVDLTQVDADHIYGNVAREFLPAILPGLLGVFLAALLAAVMSSCDSFMIAASALFTENIYRKARPNRPPEGSWRRPDRSSLTASRHHKAPGRRWPSSPGCR